MPVSGPGRSFSIKRITGKKKKQPVVLMENRRPSIVALELSNAIHSDVPDDDVVPLSELADKALNLSSCFAWFYGSKDIKI